MHKDIKSNARWYGLIAVVVLIFLTILVVGCSGQVGPAGPAGPAGAAGTAGPAGATGAMATATCSECHNETTVIKARQVQYEASLHGDGFTFERNGTSCAACHTAEGFAISLETGSKSLDAVVDNPSPINCRTCHEIHETYTDADWALQVTDPVTIDLTGDTIDLGEGNLCASCHQPREVAFPEVGSGDFEVTSIRFGPHHGPQSTMLFGLAGYGDYTGSSGHSLIENTCTTCHMADAYGKQSGGHTMSMAYEYHEADVQNTTGCASCHTDIDSFNVNGALDEIEELGNELQALLIDAEMLGEDGYAIPGTYTSAQAGALWNYRMVVLEDRSGGVHNPGYAKFLLETGISALK